MPTSTITQERKAVVDMVGFDAEDKGDVAVRVAKLTYVDGELVRNEPHRFVLSADADVEGTLALVQTHLVAMGFGALDAEGLATIRAAVAQRHTPERVVAAKEAAIEADEKRLQSSVDAVLSQEATGVEAK